jgi:hypothetical protein
MELTQKIGKLIVFNVVMMIVLLIALLFFIQRGQEGTGSIEELAGQALLEKNIRELYTEATDKPYFETHPEELQLTDIKFADFMFIKIDGQGNAAENTAKEFVKGENVTFSFSLYDYMNPKVADYKYVYGIKVWVETTDSDGNKVDSLTGLAVDTADYTHVKGRNMRFNIILDPDDVKPGMYKVTVTAFDAISRSESIYEEGFMIV